MAVDLVGGGKMDDLVALQEATDAGVRSLEHLVFRLSHLRSSPSDCSEIAITTISKFKQVISVLDRTGHARFRRGQVPATDGRPSLEGPNPGLYQAGACFVRELLLPLLPHRRLQRHQRQGGPLCDLACALRREAPSLVVVPQEEMPRAPALLVQEIAGEDRGGWHYVMIVEEEIAGEEDDKLEAAHPEYLDLRGEVLLMELHLDKLRPSGAAAEAAEAERRAWPREARPRLGLGRRAVAPSRKLSQR
ncbi:hypothetical protein BHE74_00016613 [Ensete ventricosum]|nr:hypothetical protein BHE74_00016613 [Ensete ventricosum]